MPRERENRSKKIKVVEYNIKGNDFRAYYDGAHELIFVLDETINADKPNVLLVIDSFDDRKWDDVLSNDYGIDLETVRPKRDNKYQKLDIEYSGLDVYSELFDAYDAEESLKEPLENLKRFRIMSVRRAARERLDAAEDAAAKARETIERTNETISELRDRIKTLRSKLSEQRRGIGREPTKSSAAKILKTEAQIDATNEKLARAKKRLDNAQRRLVVAEDDAEIARAILARHADFDAPRRTTTKASHATTRRPVVTQPVVEDEEETDDYTDDEENDSNYADDYIEDTYEEDDSGADEEMPDNDAVKPLFDRDPEILDDNIAFKPIDFDAPVNSAPRSEPSPSYSEPVAPAPLSFTPPTSSAPVPENNTEETSVPMLDSLTPVEQPAELENTFVVEPAVEPAPADVNNEPVGTAAQMPEPVAEIETIEPVASVEPIAPARPVSPITGNTITQTDVHYAKKPTFIYYIMLILLIALSIFTLWLYQTKNGAVLPDLAATTTTTAPETAEPATDTKKNNETNIPSPFVNPTVDKAEPATVSEPEPIVESTAQEEPAPVVEPEPVAVAVSEIESEPIAAEPEPVAVVATPEPDNISVESPFVDLRTVANYEPEKKPIPTEEEILARKPGYSVSQNEKMFVAAPEYDSETVVESNYSPDTDVQPMPVATHGGAPEIVASEVLESDVVSGEVETCSDGAAPDANGCCAGETYMYTSGEYMCCVDGDCFPPLQ